MAFSALVSCETPTTEFRMRIVRIWGDWSAHAHWAQAGVTHNRGVYKCCPSFFLLKKRKYEGHCSGTKQDEDQLILELLEDEFPDGRRWIFW